MPSVRPRPLVPLVLAACLVGAVAGVAIIAAPPVRAADHAVTIADFAFAPAELTITAGDSVTWTNADPVAHTATSTSGAFDTGDLEQGESSSVTFTEPGTYDYLCTPHPSMTGRIVVRAAAAPAPTAAPGTPVAGPADDGGALPDVAMPVADPVTPALPTALGLLALAIALGVRVVTRGRSVRG